MSVYFSLENLVTGKPAFYSINLIRERVLSKTTSDTIIKQLYIYEETKSETHREENRKFERTK